MWNKHSAEKLCLWTRRENGLFARITKGKDVNFLNKVTNNIVEGAYNKMQQDAQKVVEDFKPIKNYGMGIYDARNEPIPNKRICRQEEKEEEYFNPKYY